MGLFGCLPWGKRNAVAVEGGNRSAVSTADSDAAQLGGRGAVPPQGHNKADAESGKGAGEQVGDAAANSASSSEPAAPGSPLIAAAPGAGAKRASFYGWSGESDASAPATLNHRASSPHLQPLAPSGPGAAAYPPGHPSNTLNSTPLPRPSISEPGTPPPLAAPQSLPLNDDGSFTYRPYTSIGHTLKAPAHAHLLAPISHHPRAAALVGQLPALGKRPLPFLGAPLTSPTPAASRSNSLTAAALPGSLPSLPYGTARPLLRPGSDSGLAAGGGLGGLGMASVVPPVRSRFAQQHQQQLLHQSSAGRISPVSPAAAAASLGGGGAGAPTPPPWADAHAPAQPRPHAPAPLPPVPPASSQPHQHDASSSAAGMVGQAPGSVWGGHGAGGAAGPERRGSRSFKAGSGGGGGASALERAASRSQATLERVSSGLERPRSNSGLGGMAAPPQSQPSHQQQSSQQQQEAQGAAGQDAGAGVPGGQAAAAERPFTPAMARREAARANESLLSNLLGGGRPGFDFGSVKVSAAGTAEELERFDRVHDAVGRLDDLIASATPPITPARGTRAGAAGAAGAKAGAVGEGTVGGGGAGVGLVHVVSTRQGTHGAGDAAADFPGAAPEGGGSALEVRPL